MLQSKNALASSLRLCQIMYVLHTQPKANLFLSFACNNLHVAVDNDVFAKLPRCCSVDHPFRYSAAAPAEARQRHIVNILCDFCGKSFPNSWAYERHRTCTKLKGTGCYSQATHKVELLTTRRGTMATAMLSRSLSQGHRGSYMTRK